MLALNDHSINEAANNTVADINIFGGKPLGREPYSPEAHKIASRRDLGHLHLDPSQAQGVPYATGKSSGLSI